MRLRCNTTPHPADSPNDSLPVPVADVVALCCSCVVQNEMILAKAYEKARTEKKKVHEDLSRSQAELCRLRDKLAEIEAELQSTKQE